MKTPTGSLVIKTSLAGLMSLMIVACDKTTQPPLPSGPIPPGTTVGTEIDDTVITAAIKAALLANPEVKSLDLQVETRKGEAQLSGFVDSQGQIDRATAVAKNVSGVKSVQNKMTLKGSPASVGNKVDDSIVTTRVKSALLSDDSIKSHDIAVITRKGEVQLSGFVDNQLQIDRALVLTRGVEGVVAVNNEMSIKK
jgi:hyperosmotically inducible protein